MIVKIKVNGIDMYLSEFIEDKKSLVFTSDLSKAKSFESELEIKKLPFISNYEIIERKGVLSQTIFVM